MIKLGTLNVIILAIGFHFFLLNLFNPKSQVAYNKPFVSQVRAQFFKKKKQKKTRLKVTLKNGDSINKEF